jgi:aryl sulfotransferase
LWPQPDALWPQLVEAATFEAMKRDSAGLIGPAHLIFDGGADRFFFKGSNNRWKEQVAADDLALSDALATRLSPGLRRWIEHGRLIAGDPVASVD